MRVLTEEEQQRFNELSELFSLLNKKDDEELTTEELSKQIETLNELWDFFCKTGYNIEIFLQCKSLNENPIFKIFKFSIESLKNSLELLENQNNITGDFFIKTWGKLTNEQRKEVLQEIIRSKNKPTSKNLPDLGDMDLSIVPYIIMLVSEENFKRTKQALTLLELSSKHLADVLLNIPTIVAKQNRAKRNNKPNPNIEKAREAAKKIWEKEKSKALLDTAYQIKSELNLKVASTSIQEWIRDLNPNKKKTKSKE
ncbi:hypothetical protein AM305_04933 [Actinobacillus minor NM305]|uniref:Uncharacterized protein n=1 Tax=Actinobacillus minor NM305 TaxID=637911 RepID=C5RZ64_9PAST|nr:hypothetical protein [Actinobacillus minor]EER48087.1 hypothetical protein AM305_04933 [Actinobacillus minor NM305]